MHNSILLLIELLTVATFVAMVARWLRMPYSTLLVVTGLIIGYLKLLPDVELNSAVVLNLFLPVLLFEAAINTDATHLRENIRPVALLSTLGMFVMAAVTGMVVHVVLGLPIALALLLGCMLSITDTVAVLAIFKDLKVPARLSTIVEGESLFNDGTALVLFRLILAVVITGHFSPVHSVWELIVVFVGGLATGGAIGLVASFVLKQIPDHLTEIMLSVLVALGSYFVAEQMHVSGVIAVVVAGLVVGNYGWRRSLAPSSQVALGSFWEYAGFGVNSAVFLLVGLNLNVVDVANHIPWIVVAFLAVHLGRLVAIYPGFMILRLFERDQAPVPLKWQHVMLWGNIKGSLTMALAISLPANLPHRQDIITVTFGVVLLSLLIQGLSLGPLVRALGVAGGPSLRRLFEKEQLKLIAARAAQNEIRTLHEAGILSKSNSERLRSRYQVSIAQAERELRRLGSEFQDHWDEVLAEIRQRLLLVEKGAVLNAQRQSLVSQEVAREFLADLDERLVGQGIYEPPTRSIGEKDEPGYDASGR